MELNSTVFNLQITYSTIVRFTPIKTITTNWIPFTNMTSSATVSFPILPLRLSRTSMYYAWTRMGCW